MQAQTYMSGQISGQVPNQASSQLLGVSAHSGGSLAPQMQNLGGLRSNSDMDQEYQMKHQFIRQKIYRLFQQRQPNPEMIPRIKDTVTRVEQLLYRNAGSKEEYVNMETFEQRFLTVIRYLQSVNQSQKLARPTSSSSPVGTMIPTPGMGNTGNFNSTIPSSASDPMIVSAGVNNVHHNTAKTGQILPTTNSSSGSMHGSSFKPSNGSLTNGYEQSLGGTSFGSGGTNMIQSVMAPRIPGQMVPTPGMSNTQSSINSETSNSGRGFSGVESAMISQVRRSNQIGSQNRRMLQNLGGQASTVTASNLQQKDPPYGFPNGTLNGGLGLIGGNMMMSGPASSDSYLTGSAYGNSPMSVPQRGDQQQQLMPTISQQMMPLKSDGYSMNSDDLSGSRNLYRTVTSIRSSMDNQNMNPVSMQSNTNTNSLMINQANLHAAKQNADGKPQMLDHSCKTSSQSPHDQQYLSNFQQHTFHQNHNLQQQLFVQNQQKQQSNHHNQLLLENDSSRQSQLAPHLGSQVVPEHVMEFRNEVLHSEDAEQFELSELQHQNRVAEEHHRSTQMPSHQFGANNFPVSFPSQTSQHIHQMLQPQDLAAEPQNIFACFGGESQPQGQCHPQLQEKFITVEQSSNEQHIQNGVCQRISEQDAVEQPHLSSEGSIASQTALPSNTLMPQASTVAAGACNSTNPEKQFLDQRRWLLFLYHARNCSAPEGKCAVRNCTIAQKLLKHMSRCNIDQCPHQRCHSTRRLIQHFRSCRDLNCPLCIPLRRYIEEHRKARTLALSDTGPTNSMNGMRKSLNAGDGGRLTAKASISIAETSEDLQPSLKRMKMDHPSHSLGPSVECSPMQRAAIDQSLVTHDEQPNISQHSDMQMASISKFMEDKNEHSATGSSTDVNDVKTDESVDIDIKRPVDGPIISSEPVNLCKQESMNAEERFDQSKQESASVPEENAAGKSGKPKVKGVSLMELFTPEQIREHIVGLRQWVGQSKAKAEKNQAMEHSMDVNSCQLCAVEKLAFEPPPIYCTPCGARIKRNATFHTMGSGDTRHYFCTPCYNEARGDHIEVDGALIPKIRLEKKRNNEETEEGWVQCDKCELWQHQICALFNARRNDGGQAEYTCPNCYMVEVERGDRMPLPQSSVLGAKDLPRTILSDFIEHRLFRRLKQEKQERAFLLGKSTDEILGAEALVVRVVSSVDKKLEVKQRFLEIFQEVNYPSDFPYKSKVILLFQKIEGVEVCLFGMYVQEFGSESQYPNQRRVYLSYLDSVKYFRPDIKTATGEALRTYVYHEILIGYLEYCKNRGFTSCYIWACPPLKGEDYILYCHPEIQKTPKSDKLREWYLSMLRKASKESIVVELTNLYDHFFVSNGECKAKVTAARLPYFDGDYWPGAAEDMINQIQQEQDGTKQQKKGKTKITISKRALKAAGQTDLSANASKDFLLMHKLGETISPMKEDFIMVHLQHSCSHCCHLMVSGNRWVCKQCKKFQLCDKCYDSEQKVEEREKHPINSRDKHSFHPIEIRDVPVDTKDPDDILESEFFDTRQAFLSLCQGNHYQYDTLRRAKHSSMMVLYHLHNPTAPAFVSNCHSCLQEIEAGQGWRCEICPDYDVCNACYQKGVDHPHMLTNHPSSAERDAQNTEARQIRVSQLRKMLDLLIHASQCKLSQCQYPHCRKVKGLFRHGMHCKTRASGGCLLCKRMWYLLQLHARTCKESACRVPRCKDLKEHLKRLNQQAESRRRAAVMEMMRQRAAEVAGNNG